MRREKDFINYLNSIQEIAREEGFDSLDEVYVQHLRGRFFNETVVIGKSERVLLRELKVSDLDAIYAFADAHDEPVLNAFIKNTKEESEQHLKCYIEMMYPMYDHGIWAAELLSTQELIGLCGIGQTEVKGECCTDLGYYICPKWRNQGLATECIQIVLDYAKNYLEFLLIYAIIKEENRFSKGILRKFNFEYIGVCERTDGKVSVYQKDLSE